MKPSDTTLVAASRAHSAWIKEGRSLAIAAKRQQFEIGDWLVVGEEKWQRKAYNEAVTIFTGHNRATLRNLAHVARKVPSSLRNYENLSWNHYAAVARFKPEYQRECLESASKQKWSTRQLRAFIAESHASTCKTKKSNFGSIPFTPEQKASLAALAKTRNKPVAAIVRDLVAAFLQKPEIAAEIRGGHV
jgi:hypothetical protein